MSSNRTFFCGYCKKRIQEFIQSQYAKLPEKLYEKLRNADKIDEILNFLPDELTGGDVRRIEGCNLDYDFVEDWGEGVWIDEDGSLIFDVSCSCDLCGINFDYVVKLPPTPGSSTQKIIDLIRKDKVPGDDKQKGDAP